MCQKNCQSDAVLLPELYDIHGRRLQVGDRVLVEAASGVIRGEAAIHVATLRTRVVYELAYDQPTAGGVSFSNLAYCDELSDLQRRRAVKITDEPINPTADATA